MSPDFFLIIWIVAGITTPAAFTNGNVLDWKTVGPMPEQQCKSARNALASVPGFSVGCQRRGEWSVQMSPPIGPHEP